MTLPSKILLLLFAMGKPVFKQADLSPVTNPSGSDGFGAQFLYKIASMYYAEVHGKKYVYTPFKSMEHNYDQDPDFLLHKEWLINFVDNIEHSTDKNVTVLPSTIIETFYYEKDIALFAQSTTLSTVKKLFRANKDKNNYFDNQRFNIAVHVRRPNPHDTRPQGADTPDETYLTIIEKLRGIYPNQQPLFHIYSQGEATQLSSYCGNDIALHLNESIEDTFCQMVFADVLVTSTSALSYCAGILSNGIVYYIPFWHVPLPHWKNTDVLQQALRFEAAIDLLTLLDINRVGPRNTLPLGDN